MNYMNVLWKTLFTFLLLWLISRMQGKSQISHLTLFDYITGITIGALAANLVTPGNEAGPLTLSVVAWGLLTYLARRLDLTSRTFQRLADGVPVVVVRQGQVMEQQLRKAGLTLAELEMLLRQRGFFSLAEVAFAIMETDGQLSVLPRSDSRPVQPRDLGITPQSDGLTHVVIQEGKFRPEALARLGRQPGWVEAELARQGLVPDQVFAAWLDHEGKLTLDLYADQRPPAGGETGQPTA